MKDNFKGGRILIIKEIGELNAIIQKALWNGWDNRYRNREHDTFKYSTEALWNLRA